MDCDRGEVAVIEQLVEFDRTNDCLDEDNDLVEDQSVQQVTEFSVLFLLFQLDEVLLQTVKSQLSFVVDNDFERLLF